MEKECFVPTCGNTSTKNPNKLFVRVREDLKKTWCDQVNAPHFRIYLQYICEDHLLLQEDLKNYHQWKFMGAKPMLKPTAKLRDIHENVNTQFKQQSCSAMEHCPSTSKDSELMKILLKPVENLNRPKKLKLDENVMPSTTACTLPVKVNAFTQCSMKMVDKSTNYKARKIYPRTQKLIVCDDDIESSPNIISSPSLFGATSETETTTAEESVTVKTFTIRTNLLELIKKKPKMYLGLPIQFMWLIDYIISKSSIKTTFFCLVITLFKIRQCDSMERMSCEFEISKARISTMFAQGIEVLANFFQNLIYMPPALQIKRNLPLVFKIRYSNVQMIIDCFEIQIEKPSDPINQSQSWSQYKNCNTIKYLVGATPNGFINFISTGYGGRISDKALVIKSQLLDVLPQNAVLLADRGFKEVECLLMTKGVKLLRPPSVYSGQKPTKEEVIHSKTIASLRIHIERVIRRIREFKFLKPHAVVNSKHIGYLDKIVIIACGLINLQNEIIKYD